MRGKHIWVVEMLDDVSLRWVPTVGIGLSRDDGREELRKWKDNNPDDRFRLRKYMKGAE